MAVESELIFQLLAAHANYRNLPNGWRDRDPGSADLVVAVDAGDRLANAIDALLDHYIPLLLRHEALLRILERLQSDAGVEALRTMLKQLNSGDAEG